MIYYLDIVHCCSLFATSTFQTPCSLYLNDWILDRFALHIYSAFTYLRSAIMRAILISIIALLQLANAAPRESQHDNRASARIKWAPCEPDIPNLKCGQLTVPLDWSKPHGKQITLAVNKVKASDPSKRIGSVVVNPGGPGGSGTQVCQKQAQGNLIISETTNEYFDIVCPDPRGVGNSAPIRCDYSLWNQRLSLFPTDPASYNELLKHNKAFGQSCLDLSGDIVNHVDTLSVVKDVEALRVALGEGKLNWIGLSYGTMIGLQYAELFPQNIVRWSSMASTTILLLSFTLLLQNQKLTRENWTDSSTGAHQIQHALSMGRTLQRCLTIL